MGMIESIVRLFDPYERHARLYPALLVFLPVGLTAFFLYGAHVSLMVSAVGLLAGCGVLFWIAGLVRDAGKKREPGLFDLWGGKPTTQLLRHRNSMFDVVTKKRYHAAISKAINLAMPTSEQEANDPAFADQAYASATKWLLERTRDPIRFALLLKENYSYGFHRNMLGARWLGIVVALGAILWITVDMVAGPSASSLSSFSALLAIPATHKVSIAGSAVLLLLWVFGVNAERVRSAAFAYAERLLATCESTPGDSSYSQTPSEPK